jgi:hypothetical protein
MTSDIEDPFAGADETDDEFDTPQMEFVTIHDLKDRLCIINAKRMEVGKSKQGGEEYEFVVADVIIVDGETTDLIDRLPFVAENMHINAKALVSQLRDRVGRNRPYLCRIDAAPSSFNRQVMAYGVRKHEITDADKAAAMPAWRKYTQDHTFA